MASSNTDMKNGILKRLTAHNHELTGSPESWVVLLKTCQELAANQWRPDRKAIILEEHSQTLSDWFQEQLTMAYYEELCWPMSKAIFLLCVDIEAVPNSNQLSALFRAEKRPAVALERYLSIRPCNKRYVRHVFDNWLVLLGEYRAEHGSMQVPEDYRCKTGQRLGEWVLKTQSMYKNMMLSVSEIQRLKRLGFSFEHSKNKVALSENILKEYVTKQECAQKTLIAKGTKNQIVTSSNLKNEAANPKFLASIIDTKEARLESSQHDILISLKQAKESYLAEFPDYKKQDKNKRELHNFIVSGFDELSSFIYKKGLNNLPKSFKTASGFKLGLWCATFKARAQKGLAGKFPQELLSFI